MEIIKIFKRIWNFFRPEKKKSELGCDGLPRKKDYEIVAVDIDKTCVYCLGEKRMEFNGKMVNCPKCEGTGKYTHWGKIKEPSIQSSEAIREKLIKLHTQQFRNQQLTGKIYNIGKSRFRIKNKIGASGEKLKYRIELLT